MVYFIFYLLVCMVTFLFTRNSAMSWGWAYFFSIFFTPIVGIIFTFWIGRYGHSKKKAPTDQSQIMRAILCGGAAIGFFIEGYVKWPPSIVFDRFDDSYYYQQLRIAVEFIMLGIGFLGNTIYVLSYVDTENYDGVIEMYKES